MEYLFLILFLVSGIFIFVGLIAPNFLRSVYKRDLTRKQNLKIYGILTVVFFVCFAITAPEVDKSSENAVTQTQNEIASTETQLDQESTTQVESNVAEGQDTVADSNSYQVTRVIDGDTIEVSIDGKTESIRLIGINTPETVDPRKPVECFGVEASNKAKELLSGKTVTLESDSSQGERDKYGRLLRYVFIEGGINFNLLMIQTGFAYEYTYDLPYKYQSEFKEAQQQASARKIGLWGNTCQDTAPQSPVTTPAVPVSTPITGNNSCTIKGNINSEGEKIFHSIGCQSYNKTVIDESAGEKWFCSEQDALDAGWRKALNC